MVNKNENIITQFEPLFSFNVGGGQPSSNVFDTIRSKTGIERVFYMYFFNLVTNIFKWNNLPESCDAPYIETMLCFQGKNSIVRDKNNGLMSPQCVFKKIDWYGRPVAIDCIANNYNATFNNSDDFVIIRNTSNYIPTFLYIDYFVQQIIRIKEIADININAQKTPVVFSGTREQRELLKAEFQKYDGNEWYMFLEKNAVGNIECVNTNAPYIADKLNDLIKYYTDMFLTFIGLNNANGTFKRERSLMDEVTANNEVIGLTIESMLSARQKACDEINEKFSTELNGNKVECVLSDEVQKVKDFEPFKFTEIDSDEGGEEDE